MSQVNSVGNNVPIQPVKGYIPPRAAGETQRPTSADKLELSGVSHLLQSLKDNDIRPAYVFLRSRVIRGELCIRCVFGD